MKAFSWVLAAFTTATPFVFAAQGETPGKEAPREFRRLDTSTEEELRVQLTSTPIIGLGQAEAAILYAMMKNAASLSSSRITTKKAPPVPLPGQVRVDIGPTFFEKAKRTDFTSLTWRVGPDCQLGKDRADALHALSIQMRTMLQSSAASNDRRVDSAKFKALLQGRQEQWRTDQALPTLLQLLSAESTAVRSLLIDLLNDIQGKEVAIALAQRAVFDLSPEVREKAVRALASRPASDYSATLVERLQYPWPPVAMHAAEALAYLDNREFAPAIEAIAKKPDPRLAIAIEKQRVGEPSHIVNELVRVNHLSNCLLCHAPSNSGEDLVRGRVPIPGEVPPPLYYAEKTGLFVRADITFLRQDFSVIQPVLNSATWPGHQRFDYLVRKRKATAKEIALAMPLSSDPQKSDARSRNAIEPNNPYREAALFALRALRSSSGEKTSPIDLSIPIKEIPKAK